MAGTKEQDESPVMDEEQLENLYNWVDEIELSRPKKNIARDFSDGVLVAEIVKHCIPRLVELHNYNSCENKSKKKENWHILNRKVFKRLGFELAEDVLYKVVSAEPYAIEQVLMLVRRKIDIYTYEQKRHKKQEGEAQKQGAPGAMTEKGKKLPPNAAPPAGNKDQPGQISDRPEADQNLKAFPSDTQVNSNMKRATSLQNVGSIQMQYGKATATIQYKGEMVPKLAVEEREQEVLAKEETIQILQAKIRRLEHLVHLKDIRIDDLSNMIKDMEDSMRRQKIGAIKH